MTLWCGWFEVDIVSLKAQGSNCILIWLVVKHVGLSTGDMQVYMQLQSAAIMVIMHGGCCTWNAKVKSVHGKLFNCIFDN